MVGIRSRKLCSALALALAPVWGPVAIGERTGGGPYGDGAIVHAERVASADQSRNCCRSRFAC